MNYKKITIYKPGGPEVLQLEEGLLKEPEDNEVRIKILATGVAYADVLMREGVYPDMPSFPFTPGYDIVGIVDRIGKNIQSVRTGDVVSALTKIGGYAEYIFLPEKELVPVPDGVNVTEAVSLVLNYVTAWQMLHRVVNLKEGDAILVHGAAGGVGTALLQLGKQMGLRLYGTASIGKHPLIVSLGATPIDYKNEDIEKKVKFLAPDGLAAAFDGTGEWVFPSWRLLKKDGQLVVFGISSMMNQGRKNMLKTIKTYFRLSIFLKNFFTKKKRVSLYTITKMKKLHPEWFKEDLLFLFDLLKNNKIKPVIALQKPLTEAALCHELLNTSSVMGKMVLLPNAL